MNAHWNVPNVLTGVRLLMVPLFVVLLLSESAGAHRWWAVTVFLAASLTDLYDGSLARRWGQTTEFGALADPIADKALTGAAFIGLSMLGQLPWWVTVVVMLREVSITVWRFTVIGSGVVPASRGGKTKTTLQMAAIVGYILNFGGLWQTVSTTVMAAAVIVTVATGIDYFASARRSRHMTTVSQ